MDIDTQFNEHICCENCREGHREKSNEFLEHGFMKYLIDQIEFLKEAIKDKNKIIDNLFALKSSLRDEQNFSYKNVQINKSSNKVGNETVFCNGTRSVDYETMECGFTLKRVRVL